MYAGGRIDSKKWQLIDLDEKHPGTAEPLQDNRHSNVHSLPSHAQSSTTLLPARSLDAEPLQSLNPYERWGGLAAALGSCDDLQSQRAADPVRFACLSQLDVLAKAGSRPIDIANAFIHCNLTSIELDRLNSPLLDGLWLALTGFEYPLGRDRKPLFGAGLPLLLDEALLRVVNSRRQYTETVGYLLERCKSFDRETIGLALVHCLQHHHADIAALLWPLNPAFSAEATTTAILRCSEAQVLPLFYAGAAFSESALQHAAARGMANVCAFLLQHEQIQTAFARDADAARLLLEGALIDSAGNGHYTTASLLIEPVLHRAPALHRRGRLSQALVSACVNGHAHIVQLLIDNGAPLDMRFACRSIEPALHGRTGALGLLLPRTPLAKLESVVAAVVSSRRPANLLLIRSELRQRGLADEQTWRDLLSAGVQAAAAKGFDDRVVSLIKSGGSATEKSLSAAVSSRQESTVRLLLRFGVSFPDSIVCDLDPGSKDEATTLRLLDLLHSNGPLSPTALEFLQYARTPIVIAARSGRDSVVEWLLRHGASPYSLRKDVLPMAVCRGLFHVVDAVLTYAYVEVTAKEMTAAIKTAARNGYQLVLQRLLRHSKEHSMSVAEDAVSIARESLAAALRYSASPEEVSHRQACLRLLESHRSTSGHTVPVPAVL